MPVTAGFCIFILLSYACRRNVRVSTEATHVARNRVAEGGRGGNHVTVNRVRILILLVFFLRVDEMCACLQLPRSSRAGRCLIYRRYMICKVTLYIFCLKF